MALNDNAVITAAGGYVFVAAPGTAAPTPAELELINPDTFGAQVHTLTLTGTASSGTFSLTSTTETADLPHNATAEQVMSALEALASIGEGNIYAEGTLATGIKISPIAELQGQTIPLSVDDSALVGSSPELAVSVTAAPNGWVSVGHTSAEDMPEFGFEGGETEVKRTWQKKALREVETEPLADFLTMFLHQFDTNSFSLYYGENASETPGVFGVEGETVQFTEKALFILIVDGPRRVGFYAPKSSIRRDDSIGLPIDEFATLPIRATFVKLGARRLYDWISEKLFS
ncbi:phage tail tube protein [Nocardia sp. NPDC001965]